MARKRKSIDLTDQAIEYRLDEGYARVIRFDPDKMSVEIAVYVQGEDVDTRHIPFAHLPRDIKRLIRPL